MTWHLDPGAAEAYRSGDLGEAASLSVEAHTLSCDACRPLIAAVADRTRLDGIWTVVVDSIDQPITSPAERILSRVGVPASTARLLAITPSIRGSWALAMMAALFFALSASPNLTGTPLLFLILAPLVPLSGIALSFGRAVDPVHEVGLASPTGGFRLLLIRATAVLSASILISAVPALILNAAQSMALWLLPGLAVTVLTLALSSVTPMSNAAGMVAALWMGGVAVTEAAASARLAAFSPSAQLIFGLVAVSSISAVAWRRDSFERLGRGRKEGL